MVDTLTKSPQKKPANRLVHIGGANPAALGGMQKLLQRFANRPTVPGAQYQNDIKKNQPIGRFMSEVPSGFEPL
jgi:hypothetical protein